jgi:TPP-dependent pyruvate/acetoin dehydrogenase alpha subunit
MASRRSDRKVTSKSTTNSSSAKASAPAAAAAADSGFSPSNHDVLQKLYTAMLRCRMLQQHLAAYSEAATPVLGREAIATGTTATLTSADTVATTVRDVTPFVALGMPLHDAVRDWPAFSGLPDNSVTTCSVGDVADRLVIRADPFHAGTGHALTRKLEKNRSVVVAFADGEAESLERWHDAFEIASSQRLPIVYVVARRVWAGSKNAANRKREDFFVTAEKHGFRGILVDGHDVVAVYRVAQESIHRARQGTGPTLIECKMGQTEQLPQGVDGTDALARLERYMSKHGAWNDFWSQQVTSQVRAELDRATESFRRTAVRA